MEWILIADLNRLGRVSSFIWTHLHLVCVCVCMCVSVCVFTHACVYEAWGRARVCNNYDFTLFRHLEKRAKQSSVISVYVWCIVSANVVSVSAHTHICACVRQLCTSESHKCVYVCTWEKETVCICSRILTLQKWHVFSIYPILSPHIRCLQKTEH